MTGGNTGDDVMVEPDRAEGSSHRGSSRTTYGPGSSRCCRPSRKANHPGRRRLDDRKVLCGILFVLNTGIPWEFLPQELGFGAGMTCWRRLRDWHQARGLAAAA